MRVMIGLALFACAACSSAEESDCEEALLADLRSPSTFSRVGASSYDADAGAMKTQTVTIEYDAANAYGAVIRDKAICQYIKSNDVPAGDRRLSFQGGTRSGS